MPTGIEAPVGILGCPGKGKPLIAPKELWTAMRVGQAENPSVRLEHKSHRAVNLVRYFRGSLSQHPGVGLNLRSQAVGPPN